MEAVLAVTAGMAGTRRIMAREAKGAMAATMALATQATVAPGEVRGPLAPEGMEEMEGIAREAGMEGREATAVVAQMEEMVATAATRRMARVVMVEMEGKVEAMEATGAMAQPTAGTEAMVAPITMMRGQAVPVATEE